MVNSLRNFPKTFDKSSKGIQIPLPKPKNELDTAESKDSLFAYYCKDIIEHTKRQFFLWFRFENNNSFVFSIKKFELQGNHFLLPETVNLSRRKTRYFYKDRYNAAKKCEKIEGNYDV